MLRNAFLALWLILALMPTHVCQAAPPGPADLARSIETARKAIAEHEKTIGAYTAEMRTTVANDPASAKRREEIRILKQYYAREIEELKAKIAGDYKKIQEFHASGAQ